MRALPTLSPEVTVDVGNRFRRQCPLESGDRSQLKPCVCSLIDTAAHKEILGIVRFHVISVRPQDVSVNQLTITIDLESSLPAKVAHDVEPLVCVNWNGDL